MDRWPSVHVEALSPDAASTAAGRKLAVGSGWSGEGCTDAAVWGQCQGSGKHPYRTVVDLAGPAYHCSCPSRKFPCKHALALLLRWSAGQVPDRPEPDEHAAAWLASRTERAEKAAVRAQATATREADPQAAAQRAAARAAKVSAGLADLDRWLSDQIRGGLAGLPAKGYAAFEPMAARMVDAQAPGVASWLRSLAGVVAGGGSWPDRLLQELALLRLLVRAHQRLDELNSAAPDLAATVRQHVGYPMAKEQVLSQPGVVDLWAVWGVRDSQAGNLEQRTVWVQGTRTGRTAVILSFAAPGQSLDASLVPGTALEGAVHFYPGARPHRGLLGELGPPTAPPFPAAGRVADATVVVADSLAADPWARGAAVWVHAVPLRRGERWLLVDETGDALALTIGDDAAWRLAAVCGGRPHPVLADWSPVGWSPVSVAAADGLVLL